MDGEFQRRALAAHKEAQELENETYWADVREAVGLIFGIEAVDCIARPNFLNDRTFCLDGMTLRLRDVPPEIKLANTLGYGYRWRGTLEILTTNRDGVTSDWHTVRTLAQVGELLEIEREGKANYRAIADYRELQRSKWYNRILIRLGLKPLL